MIFGCDRSSANGNNKPSTVQISNSSTPRLHSQALDKFKLFALCKARYVLFPTVDHNNKVHILCDLFDKTARSKGMTLISYSIIRNSGLSEPRSTQGVHKQKNDNVEGAPRSGKDWALLVSSIAATANANAFKSLFNHFAPRVKSFMLRSGLSEGAAEEIAQETLMTVWRKAEQYNADKAAVSTWIFTIARNKKIDKFRKDSRPLPDVNDPSFSMYEAACPEEATEQSLNADLLYEALETLPDDQKEVLVLSFIKDNPHREIAEQLNIPLGTVKSRIRLGLSRLRDRIEINDTKLIGNLK